MFGDRAEGVDETVCVDAVSEREEGRTGEWRRNKRS